ncbi:hypothetical protein F9278_17820 [Streptomyces phaeolivaceus]|uniref:Uncharacterized protein n=1 Tax=Streptomyces phaeolivaceus TaxID=2653200 RepID=A0A5P8K415_9ACTN|nr:hypothetical protein [Streptomyces phaeolivaceus]QFQ97776.1 hypothetical protein F9278_17820 [Streptomyces phaeolivaceus]
MRPFVDPECRRTDEECPCADDTAHRDSWKETGRSRLAADAEADADEIAAPVDDTLLQRADQTDKALSDHEDRPDTLEGSRRPLPSLATLAPCAAPAVTVWSATTSRRAVRGGSGPFTPAPAPAQIPHPHHTRAVRLLRRLEQLVQLVRGLASRMDHECGVVRAPPPGAQEVTDMPKSAQISGCRCFFPAGGPSVHFQPITVHRPLQTASSVC